MDEFGRVCELETSGNQPAFAHKMEAMIRSGLDITPIITHRFSFDDFQKGFDAMVSGQSGKVILSLG